MSDEKFNFNSVLRQARAAHSEIERLEAERDKLKDAMKDVRDTLAEPALDTEVAAMIERYTRAALIVRAALGETEKPKLPRDFLEAK